MLKFSVPGNIGPIMLRDFLRKHIKLSLTVWRKVKREGTIEVNGMQAFPGSLVSSGDTIHLNWRQECNIQPISLPLSILYEDDSLLIINKPTGILVHPACGHSEPTIANGIIQYYRSKNCQHGFHPVHRLDRNTSGLLLIAKTAHVQHLLSRGQNLQITRRYLAIVTGVPFPAEGKINLPIGRRPGSIIERTVCPEGKEALTFYRTVRSFQNASLLEIELQTGRTHQIRVHLSHLQHPLLGDDLYGGSSVFINRPALHSCRLELIHPIRQEAMCFSIPLPADMQNVLDALESQTGDDN